MKTRRSVKDQGQGHGPPSSRPRRMQYIPLSLKQA